jgi:hypothetical protein
MLRKSLLVFFILCAAILIGCSKTETGNSNGSSTSSNTAGSSNTGGSSTTASGDKIGVAECDDYIAKYESCVRSKVPEAQRAQMENAFKQARDGYKRAAETPQGKASLASICKQANDAAAASMKAAYGCTF